MNTHRPARFLFSLMVAVPSWAAVNVPLTVQEALYDSIPGIARTNEPFCAGIPIPDSARITTIDRLGLLGASASQFRILARWPSGNVKWVKVCGVVPSLSAGGTITVTLTENGSGNSGGQVLATDAGATIKVNTGTAVFTIRKANYNLIDSVVVGNTTVVASSSAPDRGLIVTGPSDPANFPANVTCAPDAGGSACTNEYSSARDAKSTCSIEENGPVMAVVKCIGAHIDNGGNAYMHFTVRKTFYAGKTGVKVSSTLRNANYSTSAVPSPDCNAVGGSCKGQTFNTAFKGLRSYEMRVSPNISGALNYTIAAHTGDRTGTLGSSGSAWIYQGQSSWMVPSGVEGLICNVGSNCAAGFTPDKGYRLNVNGSDIVTGTTTQYPAGWADIRNASGAGMQIGMYQFAAQWPASLELLKGGSDVRIGLLSGRNTANYYQPWGEWRTHESYFNFHATASAALSSDFLKQQHFLLARAPWQHYNDSGVFMHPIVDPAVEDRFYIDAFNAAQPKDFTSAGNPAKLTLSKYCWQGQTANCSSPDRGTSNLHIGNALALGVHRGAYEWGQGGSANQSELRLSDLTKFLQRGLTGRYLNSMHFYRYLTDRAWAHSDGTSRGDSAVNGFNWRSRPFSASTAVEIGATGAPNSNWTCDGGPSPCAALRNSRNMGGIWLYNQTAHGHAYGLFDFYFMTGDEHVRDAFHAYKNQYLDKRSSTNCGAGCSTYFYLFRNRSTQAGPFSPRAEGVHLITATRMADALGSIGDPDAVEMRASADYFFATAFKPDPCVNGYPAGCKMPSLTANSGSNDPPGISRIRGMLTSNSGRSASNCSANAAYRISQPLQQAMGAEALDVYRRFKGRGWSEYNLATDLMLGITQWGLGKEGYKSYGDPTRWWEGPNPTNGSNEFWRLGNGFTVWSLTDVSHFCPAGTPVPGGLPSYPGEAAAQFGSGIYDTRVLPQAQSDVWMLMYLNWVATGKADFLNQARNHLIRQNARANSFNGNYGAYRLALVASALENGGANALETIPFLVSHLGAGKYRLTFTAPTGTTALRIKWSPKKIAPISGLLGYDPFTQRFDYDPATYMTWFGANTVVEPQPRPGVVQTFDIDTGGVTGLTTVNFSVKGNTGSAGGGGVGGGDTPLPVIASFSASPSSITEGGAATLSWSVSGATSVFIAGIGSVSGSTAKSVSPTATTTYVLTASNDGGSVTATASVTVSAGDTQAPAVPSALTAAAISDSRIDLSWAPSTDNVRVAGYRIYRGSTQIGTAASTTYSDTGLVASTTYSYAVVAYDAAGNVSARSVVANATTQVASLPTSGSTIRWQCVAGSAANGCPAPPANWVRYTGFTTPRADDVSGQVLFYINRPNGSGIYSTDMYAFDPVSHAFTLIPGGTGTTQSGCPADTAGWPTDRHPEGQMAVDTKRNVMWVFGGVNQTCSGAVVSVTSGSTTVTRVSGNPFYTGSAGSWTGLPVKINGTSYTVASVTSADSLKLTSPVTITAGNAELTLDQYGTAGLKSMYYLSLNPDPTANRMAKVQPAPTVPPTWTNSATAVYSPADDVIVSYRSDGFSKTMAVYCPATNTANPGTLTAAQIAAGCTAGDKWAEIRLNAGKVNTSGTTVTLVSGTAFEMDGSWHGKAIVLTDPRTGSGARFTIASVQDANRLTLTSSAGTREGHPYGLRPTADKWVGLVYDTANRKVILFQGANGSGSKFFNETWSYDIPSRRFDLQCRGACTPPPGYSNTNTGVPAMVYSRLSGKALYHQPTGASPADWQYDLSADTWTLIQTNEGPRTPTNIDMTMAMAGNKLVTMTKFMGVTEVWVGTEEPGTTTPASPCDLNSDGRVDKVDVQAATNQVLGTSTCKNGDLNRDGACNVLDVQMVIQAAIGGGCRSTP